MPAGLWQLCSREWSLILSLPTLTGLFGVEWKERSHKVEGSRRIADGRRKIGARRLLLVELPVNRAYSKSCPLKRPTRAELPRHSDNQGWPEVAGSVKSLGVRKCAAGCPRDADGSFALTRWKQRVAAHSRVHQAAASTWSSSILPRSRLDWHR